jgi:hypothetical protein
MALPKRPCAQCGEPYQPNAGHQKYCSPSCNSAAYEIRHQEKVLEYRRRWRLAHPHYRRDWWRKHRAVELARQQRWRLENRAKSREYKRRHRLATLLKAMPNDPFVHEVMTAMFMARSNAFQASHAHLRRA